MVPLSPPEAAIIADVVDQLPPSPVRFKSKARAAFIRIGHRAGKDGERDFNTKRKNEIMP